MRRLNYTVKKLEDHPVTLIELEGQLDSSNAFDQVRKDMSEYESKHIAILMKRVMYINSSGCGGLISLCRAMEADGFHLFVVEPTGNVKKVLKQIGCGSILNIVDSLQDVIQSVGSMALPT